MTEHTLAKELRERAPPSDNALFGYCGDLMRRPAAPRAPGETGNG